MVEVHMNIGITATHPPSRKLRSFEELAETLATLVRGVLGNREANPTLISSACCIWAPKR